MKGSSKSKSILEMPAPLFSLGQNIINKNEIFIGPAIYTTYFHQDQITLFMPTLFYGITDTLCATLFLPTIINNQHGGLIGNGLGDIIPGFEWAYLNKKEEGSITQATVFGQIKIPVSDRRPILTTGNVDFLIGGTLIHSSDHAYMFLSTGFLAPTWRDNFRKGFQVFYETGIGPVIHKTETSLLSIFMECNGVFNTSDINNPFPSDVTLKSNCIYVGPVIYWGYKNLLAQIGVQAPLTQSFQQIDDERKVRIGAEVYFIF